MPNITIWHSSLLHVQNAMLTFGAYHIKFAVQLETDPRSRSIYNYYLETD